MLILRKDLYSKQDAEYLVNSYKKLVEHFSRYPGATVSEPGIFDSQDTQRALDFSKGQCRSSRKGFYPFHPRPYTRKLTTRIQLQVVLYLLNGQKRLLTGSKMLPGPITMIVLFGASTEAHPRTAT